MEMRVGLVGYFCLLLTLLRTWQLCSARKISLKKSLVFGPGLNADIVVPLRYIYVQAVDSKGKNYTYSPGKDAFSVELKHRDEHLRVRAWPELLDRNDGSFLYRFRLYETYEDMSVHVMQRGKHVAQSPYRIKGNSYHEQCYCPEDDVPKWQDYMSCASSYQQIEKDFVDFPKINLTVTRVEGIKRFGGGGNHAICHYSIIANKIYRKCYGKLVDFAKFTDDWFLSLARKVYLPDMEFLFNPGDWPQSIKGSEPVPVISWCGSEDSHDIIIPTYDLTKSALGAMSGMTIDMLSVQGNTGPQWKHKVAKGLFRGRDSRQERLDLTVLGRSKPHLFDVGLTEWFFYKHDEKKYGPKAKRVSFFEFFNHKYQLNVDGTVAAYRFPYLLLGGSVVLKQDSPYYEHFYTELEPWKHYIPFKRDMSDVEKQLEWAKSHDSEARKIGLAGQQYARDNLMSDKLYCYTLKLFQEYSKRFIQKPKYHKGMQYIAQPTGDDSRCDCRRKKKKKKKSKKETSRGKEL